MRLQKGTRVYSAFQIQDQRAALPKDTLLWYKIRKDRPQRIVEVH